MSQTHSFTVGVIVNNYPGVLNRISGLFSKRCYNIDSLAVGETEDPAYSRITIVCRGDEGMRSQVYRQLQKLHDVKDVVLLDDTNSISVEHLLIKLDASDHKRADLSSRINGYGGRIVDFSDDFVTVEVTGGPDKIDALIADFKADTIELVRSGAIAIAHGVDERLTLSLKEFL